jgi:hypothetical protein
VKRFVFVQSSPGRGQLFRRGCRLGVAFVKGIDIDFGCPSDPFSGFVARSDVATIAALPGESRASVYRRVSAALGPRPKRVRQLLRSVCERVA